jgi:hypothetical protein
LQWNLHATIVQIICMASGVPSTPTTWRIGASFASNLLPCCHAAMFECLCLARKNTLANMPLRQTRVQFWSQKQDRALCGRHRTLQIWDPQESHCFMARTSRTGPHTKPHVRP